jgi:hypothetical protein
LTLFFLESNTLRLAISTWLVSLLLSSTVFLNFSSCLQPLPLIQQPISVQLSPDEDYDVMSTAVLQQPISMALHETSFPSPSNKKPAFSNPPAWFAPSYRDVINSTDSSISTSGRYSGRSLQNAPSEQLKVSSSLKELQDQKTPFLSSTSTSIASPSSTFGDLNNNSTVWSTAFSEEPQVRLPLPFSPLLAPVHLSLLLTGMGLPD